MKELRDLAARLLAEGTVNVVLGWEEGPRGVRPAFATDAAAAERLVFPANVAHGVGAVFDALTSRPLKNEADDQSPYKEPDFESRLNEIRKRHGI